MKLKYPHNPLTPIVTIEEYERRRLIASTNQDWQDFHQSVPHVLISLCPHCGQETWIEADILFTLTCVKWYQKWNDGKQWIISACKHLFCLDGALHLKNNKPIEAKPWHSSMQSDYIWMASEVPFVKPRVLNLPTMQAVIHQLPVTKGRYTAYPIVYYATAQPDDTEYCIAWAAEKHIGNCSSGALIHGKRSDAQNYELDKWIRKNSLFWIKQEKDSVTLLNDLDKFPYKQIPGRRHPFIIKNGVVEDLPPRIHQEHAEYFFEHDSEI